MGEEIKYNAILPNPNFANELSDSPLDYSLSFQQTVLHDFYNKVISEWTEKLMTYLKNNLKPLGYEFSTDNDFFEFCKSRINRIKFEEKPNYNEFYLDFVDTENIGIFIGSYSDKVVIQNDGNKITAIVGKSLSSF